MEFKQSKDFESYPKTHVVYAKCIFKNKGESILVKNNCKGKEIYLKTSGSMAIESDFSAKLIQGEGKVYVESDIKGLSLNL
ncbi:hypothetical protein D0809_06520 [Flavobacterium circumlabens]|uniref:Uncharacterized protein n=1 Tax=Flavobacterium circumlabens TaxID=2133765 RepID=A0A4Y7UEQ9_9FLAO|nr:hypothetical protein D0809_06520 [Flavobacterium circumlabens]